MINKKDIALQVIHVLYEEEGIPATGRLPDMPRNRIVSTIKRIMPNISTKDYTSVIGELKNAHKAKLRIMVAHIPYKDIIDDILKNNNGESKIPIETSRETLAACIKKYVPNLDIPQQNKVVAYLRKHHSDTIKIPRTSHLFNYRKFIKKFLENQEENCETPITVHQDVIKNEIRKFDNNLTTNNSVSAIVRRIREKYRGEIIIKKETLLYQTLLENIYKYTKNSITADSPISVDLETVQKLVLKEYPDVDSRRRKDIIHSLRQSYPIIIPVTKVESFETKLVKIIYKNKKKSFEEPVPISVEATYIEELILKELPNATKRKITSSIALLRSKYSHLVTIPLDKKLKHLEIIKGIYNYLGKDIINDSPLKVTHDFAIKTISILYPELSSKQVRGKIHSLKTRYSDEILIEKQIFAHDCSGIIDELCNNHIDESMPLVLEKKEVIAVVKKHLALHGYDTIVGVYKYLLEHHSNKITVAYKSFPYADFISQLFLKYPKHITKTNLIILKRKMVEKEIISRISDIDDNGLKKIIDNLRANYPKKILIPVKPNTKTLLRYTKNTDTAEAIFEGKLYNIICMSDVAPHIEEPTNFRQDKIFFYKGNSLHRERVVLIDDNPLGDLDPSNGFITPLALLELQDFKPYRNITKYLHGLSLYFNKIHNLGRPQRLSKTGYSAQFEAAAKELKRLGYTASYPSQIQSLFRVLLLTDIAIPISTHHTDLLKKHLKVFKNVSEYRIHMFARLKAELGAVDGEIITVDRSKFHNMTINAIDPAKLLDNTSNLQGIQHRLTYDKQSIKIEDPIKESDSTKNTKGKIPSISTELILVEKRGKLPTFNMTEHVLSTIKKSEIPSLWIEFKELLSAHNIITSKQRSLDDEMLITNKEYKKLDLQTIVNIATVKKTDIKFYGAQTAHLVIHAKIFLAWASIAKRSCLLSVNFWDTVHHRQENIGPKIAQITQSTQSEQIKHILEKDKRGEKSYLNYLISCTNLSDMTMINEKLFQDFKTHALNNLKSIPGLSTNSTREVRWRSFREILYSLGGQNLLPPLPQKNDPEFYTEKYLREFKSTQSIQRFYNIAISMYNDSDTGENYVRDMARIFVHMVKFPIEDAKNFTDDDFNRYTNPDPQNINGFHSFLVALKSNYTASRLQAKLLMTAQAILLEDGMKFKESHLIQRYATPKGKTKQALDEEILVRMKEICLLRPPPSTYFPVKKINSKKIWWGHENVEPFLPMSIFIAASFPHRSAHTINHDIDTFLQYDSLGAFSGIGIFTDKNKDRKKPFFIPKNIVYQMFGSFYLNSENQDKINYDKAKADVKLLENFVNYAKHDYLGGIEIQQAFVSNNKRNVDGKFKPLFYHPKNTGKVMGKPVFDDYFYRVLTQALYEMDIDIKNFVTLGSTSKREDSSHKITGETGEVHHLSEIPNKDDGAYKDFIWHVINKKSIKSQLTSPQGFSPHSLRISNITRLIDFDVDPMIILILSGHEDINTILTHYIDKKIYNNYEFTRKAAQAMGYVGELPSKLVPEAVHKFLLSQDNSTKELLENLLKEGFTFATIIDWDGGYRYNDDPESFLLQYDQRFWSTNPLGICTRPDCILNGKCGVCPFYLTGHSYIKNLNVMLMGSTTSLAIYGKEFYNLRTNGKLNDTEAKFAEDSQRERYMILMGWDGIIEKLSQTATNHMRGDSIIEDRHTGNMLPNEELSTLSPISTGQTIKVEFFTGMLSFYLEARDTGSKIVCKDYEIITSKLASKINRLYNKNGLRDMILKTAPLSVEDQVEWFTKLTNLTSSDEIFKRISESKSNENNIFNILDESLKDPSLTGIKKLLEE